MDTVAKAAVLIGPRELEVRAFSLPDIGSTEGLLKVEACGVCTADYPPFVGNSLGTSPYPLILGHEIVGRVEVIGDELARLLDIKKGERIVVEEIRPCGICEACLAGYYQGFPKCKSYDKYGSKPISDSPALWGGYSEYVYLDRHSVVSKVSQQVSADIAPLYLPISNGIYWVADVGGAKIGSTVIIEGPGQHGLGGVIGAKEAGAACVISIGLSHDERRLAAAKELGADYILRADVDNVVEAVKEITDGKMADMVLNTAGGLPAMETAFDLAGERATIVTSSYPREAVSGLEKINGKRLTIKGIGGRDQRSARAAIHLVESGKYPLENLATHRFSIDETYSALQAAGREGEFDAIHVTVMPN